MNRVFTGAREREGVVGAPMFRENGAPNVSGIERGWGSNDGDIERLGPKCIGDKEGWALFFEIEIGWGSKERKREVGFKSSNV